MDVAFVGDGYAISRIVTPPLENNVYMITCTRTNASVIVDPASDEDAIVDLAAGTEVSSVLATHGHFDHHGAVPGVTSRLGVPFMLHEADVELSGKTPDAMLTPGTLEIGATVARIVHTPGHTPGSCCVILDGAVITGDTLFPGGPGATRFEHSSFGSIIESIETRLFVLPDDTVVLPGHGAATTIGTERPQLPEWIERGW